LNSLIAASMMSRGRPFQASSGCGFGVAIMSEPRRLALPINMPAGLPAVEGGRRLRASWLSSYPEDHGVANAREFEQSDYFAIARKHQATTLMPMEIRSVEAVHFLCAASRRRFDATDAEPANYPQTGGRLIGPPPFTAHAPLMP
jgi:hypothetical protein